ncbi:MAG TPA: AMP-binding protein, partial [Spirochaetota bacterium]|nr:AMP-binding protein [Spirochaetota bacterium]
MKKITTIPKLYRYIQTNYNNQKFLNFPMDNKWIHYSTANFCNTVKHLALGWQALGLKKNDKVGIISDSSPYWVIMDMAVIIAGGITVPLFANISKQHMQYEIKDSKMKYFFYDHEYKHKLFSGLKKNFKKIISLYNDKKHRRSKKIICWDKLIKLGEKTAARKKKLFTNLCNKIKPQDTVTIIYTSGSTGDPKGVELSNRNITSQFYACFDRLPVWETDRCVSTLPLAHIFERTIAYYYMSSGASIYFCDSYKNVGSIMKERQPTVMTVVPRLLDAVYTKMKNKILHGSMLKKMIALPAFRKAEKHPVEQTGKRVANLLYKNMVYKKLNAALGGKLRMLISGGAAL